MSRHSISILLAACLLAASSAWATIIRVPGDWPTIRSGLQHAGYGDTVLVAPGTYHETVISMVNGVLLISEQGPEVTIIDGNRQDYIFYCAGLDSNTAIDGFTIREGVAEPPTSPGWGGGMRSEGSALRVRNNIFEDNEAFYSGAGASVWDSPGAVLSNNTFRSNTAIHADGGGMEIVRGTVRIEGNTFEENTAYLNGAGLYLYEPINCEVEGNTFLTNTGYDGGGLCFHGGYATITDNTFRGNVSDIGGGGFSCGFDCWGAVEGNRFYNNKTISFGGGIFGGDVDVDIISNILVGNTADAGGGICWYDLYYSRARIIGNFCYENEGYVWGGGIGWRQYYDLAEDGRDSCYAEIINNTVVGNTSPTGAGIYIQVWDSSCVFNNIVIDNTGGCGIYNDREPHDVTVDYNDVWRNTTGYGGDIIVGPHNLKQDPLLIWTEIVKGEAELSPLSPCINTGDPAREVPPSGGDRIDIGAWEYPYPPEPQYAIEFSDYPSQAEPGETIQWTVTLSNLTDKPVTADVWIDAVIRKYKSMLIVKEGITLKAYQTVSRPFSVHIPHNAPAGFVNMRGHAGEFGDHLEDSAGFVLEILPSSG
jgi:parallel beta-helix repeat protein